VSNSNKLVEISFKRDRKAVYKNRNNLEISKGSYVIVEADRGVDLGIVSYVGDGIKTKRGKGEAKNIDRIAKDEEIGKIEKNREDEIKFLEECKDKVNYYKLEMKLVDVEKQFDGSKITFYFTAAKRVDFRELVKDLASEYKTRIELRQIGARDEAKRVKGVGICGRTQCCTAFLSEFEQITTQLAKDQQLSLNPTKISGNCGRLLCCLRFEEKIYEESLKEFPSVGSTVKINNKKGVLTFINIFENMGQVHFEDHTYEWLPPKKLKEGFLYEAKK